jgi:hypothetical protein
LPGGNTGLHLPPRQVPTSFSVELRYAEVFSGPQNLTAIAAGSV